MNTATKILLELYKEKAPAPMFLSDTFAMTSRSIHNSGKVTFDVIRGNEKVAPVITSIEDGYIKVSMDKATNKEITPPVVKLKFPINLMNTQLREPGQTPFDKPNELQNALRRFESGMTNVTDQVKRNLEVQAAQIYQTGKLSLWGEDGNEAFAIDFLPKVTHFPTAATTWGQAGDDKLGDIDAIAKVIRKDGKAKADTLIFGGKAWTAFINDENVQKLFDNQRINVGNVTPRMSDASGTYQGEIWINNYRYEMWTYDGVYEDANGDVVPYIDDGKVVVSASSGRREKSFGMIPKVVADDPRLRGFVSGPVSANGIAVTTGASIDMDNENIFGKIGTRPILIPVAIDTHGCLTTGL